MDSPETSREKNPDTDTSTDYSRSADSPSASERSLDELVDAIDAETLEARRSRTSTTDREEMPHCPECGSVKLHHKTGGPSGTRKPGAYRCDGCNAHFDEPVPTDADDQEVRTDGGHEVTDVTRLNKAVKQIGIVRASVSRSRRLDQDGALLTAQYLVRGVKDELNDPTTPHGPDADDPHTATDGGHPPGDAPAGNRTDPSGAAATYYVVDEARPAVVDGPLPMARAKVLANEYGPDHIVAERSAIQLLESASNTTVRWETDEDVDVVTDGGRRLARRDLVDAVQADAGVGDQGPGGGCPHSDDELPCWDCLTDGEGGSQ
jgi:hypothetical protein